MSKTMITEEIYDKMLGVLPPIYFNEVDGQKVSNGFAVSEACTFNSKGVVLQGYWEEDGKYFSQWVNLETNAGRKILDNYTDFEFSTGNKAFIYN